MRWPALVTALMVLVTACGSGAQIATVSPSPSPAPITTSTPSTPTSPSEATGASPTPTPVESPVPTPSPVPQVSCRTGVSAVSMVLIGGPWVQERLLYDVSDPLHPHLLCTIANTSAHLYTGDTFEYLKATSPNGTEVILHSLGSGNESAVAAFPFTSSSASWLPDYTVAAYTTPVAPDNGDYPSGGEQVWVWANRRIDSLYTYRVGIGDCICRFGLPSPVLSLSPDGQYLVSGWIAGKGSEPLAVYRISDLVRVATLDSSVYGAFWTRSGHGLFLNRFGAPSQVWTPEQGVASLPGAGSFNVLPGLSPDGSLIAYTAYADPNNQVDPRVWTYDLKAGTTRLLVDKSRSQVLFVKDGWVWYLEEAPCSNNCAGGSAPTLRVYAMNLPAGVEQVVTFPTGDHPFTQGDYVNWFVFAPGEFWPAV